MNKGLSLHKGLIPGLPSYNGTSSHLCGGKGSKFSKFHLQNTAFHYFISVVKAVTSEAGKFIFSEFYSLN